jgi:hypothetical protein
VAPRAAVAGVSNLRAGFLCKEENSLLELMVIVVVKNFGGTADPIIQVEAENQGKVVRFHSRSSITLFASTFFMHGNKHNSSNRFGG